MVDKDLTFVTEYFNLIDACLKDVFSSDWNDNLNGINKSLCDGDPIWSNLNFVRESRMVLDVIIIPRLSEICGKKLDYMLFVSENDNSGSANKHMFKLLWDNRKTIFDVNGPILKDIVKLINDVKIQKRGLLEVSQRFVQYFADDVDLVFKDSVSFYLNGKKCLAITIPAYRIIDSGNVNYAYTVDFAKSYDEYTHMIFMRRNIKRGEIEICLVENFNIRAISKVYVMQMDNIVSRAVYDIGEKFIRQYRLIHHKDQIMV